MTTLKNTPPSPGEEMTCANERCCRVITMTRSGGYAHKYEPRDGKVGDIYKFDHTATPAPATDFKVIGPRRKCVCGEDFHYTDSGPVHIAFSTSWHRACEGALSVPNSRREPREDVDTVSADRRFPCANCGRPMFVGDDGTRARHVEGHSSFGDEVCTNADGESIDDALATLPERATVWRSVHPQPAGGPDEWNPKGLLETLNKQARHAPDDLTRDAIAKLVGILSLHRPTRSNGKHYDHTPTCGCEE